jgi:hypothetical protein
MQFQNPIITPSGRKVTRRRERKKESEITPLIVDTSFRSNAHGQRTHSARTKINLTFTEAMLAPCSCAVEYKQLNL